MKMPKIILIIIFCLLSVNLYPQSGIRKEYRLLVTLHNAPFRSLYLLDSRDKQKTFIEGDRIGQFKWEFKIPNAIISNSENTLLMFPAQDTVSGVYHMVRFFHGSGEKLTTIVNIGVQDEISYLEASYKGKTIFEKVNVAEISNITDSVTIGTLIGEDFDLILKKDSSDITVRSFDPFYCWFFDVDERNDLSYNDQLQAYISLAKRYPSSRYLMTNLALNLNLFKSRKDVRDIYQHFSAAQKSSKWSKKIELYLSGNFVNSSLVDLDSKSFESIVQDSSKYNLVIFSASWFAPGMEEVPLLKKLQKDLKDRINFTSISIDYEKDVKAFQNLMVKKEVPWRILYAYRDLDKVRDLYFVATIPYTLLIHPDGHMEIMDVRLEENQKKLYSLK